VDPTDVGLRQRGARELPPPWVPGMDAAGTVESVGDDVEDGIRLEAAGEGGGDARPVQVCATSTTQKAT